ncbi:MAG: CNNM domain-containing protein [Nocardioides sp.]
MSPVAALVLSLLLVVGNAFFVGAEFALISARRSQIEPRAQEGSRLARTTLTAMENIALVIGVNQLGITVCSLVLGAVAEPAVAHVVDPVLHLLHVPESLLHPAPFAIALLVVVFLHVVLGEMVPEHRPRRAGSGRPGAGSAGVGHRDPASPARGRGELAGRAGSGRSGWRSRMRPDRRTPARRSPRWWRSRAARGCWLVAEYN